MKPLILICSTDYEFYLLLAQILSMRGFKSSLVEGAEEALASVKSDDLAAVIIDYHNDAFRIGDLVNQIRETLTDKTPPIAVFVGAGNQQLYLEVLKTGVSEIFMRPFNPERFLSYLSDLSPDASGESCMKGPSGNTLIYAEITMHLDSMRVECNGMDVQLSPIEFRLLQHFLQKPGYVFSRDALIEAAWPQGTFVEPRTVDVHVGRLRRGMRRVLGRDIIRTVRATGYALDERQHAKRAS
ncbi:response regulator transcription factor [Rhizobium sp. CNPSo 4039]|uniref:winged helix-turn-helix transcriptional regulator n=1 Tax=Rhizobium sp. CNPSo 4039 TaxID=3021409 RepID=UPI00254E8C4C|nr:response regulator transcription factor [Rhizobium sp. CNPSo 4039]MDK4713631.1 response regulator transcription factor [Rhizobium sp. CNPSo 4039]